MSGMVRSKHIKATLLKIRKFSQVVPLLVWLSRTLSGKLEGVAASEIYSLQF
jgi:hypothetical protein